MASPFREMADWIASRFSVKVLNVEYDSVNPNDRPRLHVIVDTKAEELKFRKGVLGNFNRVEQKRIAEKFKTIIQKQGFNGFNMDGLFVVFSAFESVARIEANSSIPDRKINKLKQQLKNKDLWEISRSFDSVIFFFFTDQQLANSEKKGLREKYAVRYFELIKPYDEFDYITPENLAINFDSKQNFDENYEGNWFYYYR